MKVIFLNSKEKEVLVKLLTQVIAKPKCPYELTTILEKLDWRMYKYVFEHSELFKTND